MGRLTTVLSVAFSCLGLAACSSGSGTGAAADRGGQAVVPDAPADGSSAGEKDAPAPADTVEAGSEDAGGPAGSARLWRIESEDELLSGFNARAEVGDFRLENEHAVFIVRGKIQPAYWGPFGGNLIDADIRRAPGEEGRDLLGELIPVVGTVRAFRPKAFAVVQDGEGGGAAVLRVTGADAGIPLLDAAIPSRALGMEVEIEYRLEPGSPLLEIRTTVKNGSSSRRQVMIGDAAIIGDRLRVFYDGLGGVDEAPGVKPSIRYALGVGEGVSYGIFAAPGEALSVPLQQEELELFRAANPTLEPGDTHTATRYFGVSDGGTAALLEAFAALGGGEPPKLLRGRVEGLFKEVMHRDVHVLARDGEGQPVGMAGLDGEGGFSIPVFEDAEHHLEVAVRRVGVRIHSGVSPAGGTARPSFAAPQMSVLEVRCHPQGEEGVALPCRASLQPGPTADLGDPVVRELYAGPGRHRFAVTPGLYTVTLSRGFEYEIVRREVSLAPAAGETVTGELERSVDTKGWVATTVHVHSELSIDSTCPIDLRMYSLAAAGMEYIFPTEHDVFSDYTPYIADFGLGAWLKSDVGAEISPIGGHFNCLGCRHDPREFAVPWVETDEHGNYVRDLEAPEIWKNLRENFDAKVIQINHPFTTQAFMYSIGFDLDQSLDDLVGERFNTDFDTFEVYNSHDDRDELYYETLPGWYWLLNQGVRKTGVGAEDAHDAKGTGTPRTFVAAEDAEISAVDPQVIAQGLVTGRAVTSQGPLPELWVQDAPIGGDVSPTDGEVSIRMKVQAPTWMKLGSAKLIRSGDVVWERDLKTPEGTATVYALRMDESIERVESGPAWYALLVEGDEERMAPVYPGDAPFAITNPVWVSAE